MSLDAVPSGFTSSAAMTLLKAMRSTESATTSFIATQSSSSLDPRSKSTMTSDAMFSIIAVAARDKAVAAPSAGQENSRAQTSSADAGSVAWRDDPYYQKDYTMEQAAQNYYDFQNHLAAAYRVSGIGTDQQTNGQLLAQQQGLMGQQAADYANAFDSKTLKVIDPSTLDVGAKFTRTVYRAVDGEINGESISSSFDDKAWMAYLKNNPSTIYTDDYGFKGHGGGLIFSW